MPSNLEQLAVDLQQAFEAETRVVEQVRRLCDAGEADWLADHRQRVERLSQLSTLMTELRDAEASSAALLQQWKARQPEIPTALESANAIKKASLETAVREVRECCAQVQRAKEAALATLSKSNQAQESLAAYTGK